MVYKAICNSCKEYKVIELTVCPSCMKKDEADSAAHKAKLEAASKKKMTVENLFSVPAERKVPLTPEDVLPMDAFINELKKAETKKKKK